MGKKYIIELNDECNSEFKGIMVFGLTQEKQISVELISEESLRPYTEDSAYAHGYTEAESKYREIRDELEKRAYQRGMDDANRNGEYNADDGWYVMQKISLLPNSIKTELFGTAETAVILQGNSFKDALAKLTEYEQKQEEQIQVGDEVIYNGRRCVVLVPETPEKYGCVMDAEGERHGFENKDVEKTGRHFPEVAAIFEKMREGQEQ